MSAQEFYQGGNQNGYQQQQFAPPPGGPPQDQNRGKQEYVPPQGQAPNYNMRPSQPYASTNPETGGQPVYQDTAPFSQANEKTGERMNPRKRVNDIIPLILFIAAVIGFAVVSGIAIHSFVQVNGLGGGMGDSSIGRTGTSITLD